MGNPALTEAVYYILLSLLEPRHGYGIMQNAEQLSGGRVRLAAGTLYGALNTLLEKGWIAALPGAAKELACLVVMNTASIQLLPTTVVSIRAGLGCSSPMDILPCVLVTSILSVTAGLTAIRLLYRL